MIEKAGAGYAGHVPDLPDCVAAASSVAGVRSALAEVIPFHLDGLREGGQVVPMRESAVEWVEV